MRKETEVSAVARPRKNGGTQRYSVNEGSTPGHINLNPYSRNEKDGKRDNLGEEHRTGEGPRRVGMKEGTRAAKSSLDMPSIFMLSARRTFPCHTPID
jgi:hypothetical protein